MNYLEIIIAKVVDNPMIIVDYNEVSTNHVHYSTGENVCHGQETITLVFTLLKNLQQVYKRSYGNETVGRSRLNSISRMTPDLMYI